MRKKYLKKFNSKNHCLEYLWNSYEWYIIPRIYLQVISSSLRAGKTQIIVTCIVFPRREKTFNNYCSGQSDLSALPCKGWRWQYVSPVLALSCSDASLQAGSSLWCAFMPMGMIIVCSCWRWLVSFTRLLKQLQASRSAWRIPWFAHRDKLLPYLKSLNF